MKRHSLFFLIVAGLAMSNLWGQLIPSTANMQIGWTQRPNGPLTYDYEPATTGAFSAYPHVQDINTVQCNFPTIFDNNKAYTMVVYKASEIGVNSNCGINQLRFSVFKSPTYADRPWNVYADAGLTLSANTMQAMPVSILMRNGNHITNGRLTQPNDIESNPNWQTVWDGEYNYLNGQYIYNDVDEFGTLIIDLDSTFIYTGGDLTIVFENNGADNNINSSVWATGWSVRSNYRMEVFEVPDTEVNNEYLGPKLSFDQASPGLIIAVVDANPTADGIQLFTYNFSTRDNTYCGNGRENSQTLDSFNFSFPLNHDPANPTYSFTNPGRNSAVRPKINFIGDMMTITDVSTDNISAFVTPNDTLQVLGDLIITTETEYMPIKLKNVNFTTEGTDEHITITSARLYHNSQLVATVANPTSGTNTFTLATPVTLSEGPNTFNIVYEIPKPNATNNMECGDALTCNVINCIVGDRTAGIYVGDAIDHTLTINEILTENIVYNAVNVVNNDNKQLNFCLEEGAQTYKLRITGNTFGANLTGTFYGYQWYQYRHSTDTWETITGATTDSLIFTKDTAITAYKCKVLHPESCVSTSDSCMYTINYETTNKSVTMQYTGNLSAADLQGLEAGTELNFTANLVAGYNSNPTYRWQYSVDGGAWNDFMISSTSNTASYTTSALLSGNFRIRVRVDNVVPPSVCTTSVYSNEFIFTARASTMTFDFVNQPEQRKIVCDEGSFSIWVSYQGMIDTNLSCWQKDGIDMRDVRNRLITNRFLTVNDANTFTGGMYRYKAIATVTRLNEYEQIEHIQDTIYSEPTIVTMIPALEVYYLTQSKNYANPGSQVAFVANTSFLDNELGNAVGYQWYRYTAGQGETAVEDDGQYFFGAKSNMLVIKNIPEEDEAIAAGIFTYNNDYYFIKVMAPCDTVDTKDRPIYLFPGEGLNITQQPVDFVYCELNGTQATFEVVAEYADQPKVVYQWFGNGIPLTDGNRITGAKEAKLTIDAVTTADSDIAVHCEISLSNKPDVIVTTDSVYIQERFMNITSKNPTTDTIVSGVNQYVQFQVAWESNKKPSAYHITLMDIDANLTLFSYDVPATSITTAQPNAVLITQTMADAGQYRNFAVNITNDCGDVLTAKWVVEIEINSSQTETGIADEINLNNLQIIPNPVNDVISISYNSENTEFTSVQLCGLTGATMSTLFEGNANAGHNEIKTDLTQLNLATGTYIIRITNSKGTAAKQFIFVK